MKEVIVLVENVVLIKINKSYRDGMSAEELYNATSKSWVASFQKTSSRVLKYYCSVYKNKIIEVYDFLDFQEELPARKPPRYILEGKINSTDIRQKLIGLDVSKIHKGSGNPIKYTSLNKLLNLNGSEEHSEENTLVEDINQDGLVKHIHSFIISKGFSYSLDSIKNLYLSLRSKPFVIISGISGTGKTKIVQLFAESIGATEENNQFKLIPVRPDWSDSAELLGFEDLKGEFQKGPLTKMIEHAQSNPDLPYFVLLDEMNLARVEYYFSDVLSVRESRKREGEDIISSILVDEKYINNPPVRLPNNLYIIGTVNMDETTHPFSKKVLDRANTIEFNDIDLNSFNFLESQEEVEKIKVSNELLEVNFISIKDIYSDHMQLITDVSALLTKINKHLELVNAQVGYRVRDEICFYMAHNATSRLLEEDEGMDFCIMQKVLPRILGSDDRVADVLEKLYEELVGRSYDVNNLQSSSKYPKSSIKIIEMLERYRNDGFTSFWIS